MFFTSTAPDDFYLNNSQVDFKEQKDGFDTLIDTFDNNL
jgi:hypothetical protein